MKSPCPHISPFPQIPPPLSLRPNRIKTATMSTTRRSHGGASGALPPGAGLSFSSPSALSDFLRARVPPEALSSWGVALGTKTIHNLWIEISNGDSSLQSIPTRHHYLDPDQVEVRRVVHVAVLHTKNKAAGGATLLESHQLLSDGQIRARDRPLSEKMTPGETIEDAAARAVREELGPDVRVRLMMDTYRVEEDGQRRSESYPGLPGFYVFHTVEAVVEGGIPLEGEFSTEEHGEEKDFQGEGGAATGDTKPAVFVVKHFWRWADDYCFEKRKEGNQNEAVAAAHPSASSS